jgi:GTP-binding protein
MSGRAGASLRIELPIGTIVRDAERGHVLAELCEPGVEVILLCGGSGGRGNHAFRGPTRQTPRNSEPGEPGPERKVKLELRLLADVGLVGLPNAGKSTLLAAISRARPAIASYAFTTLSPKLGVVEHDWERITVADLPGLIEGASLGRGLGDRFLKHVERTRVLVHLVDASDADADAIVEAWRTVRAELEAYGEEVAAKPELLVLAKADLRRGPMPAVEVGRRTGRETIAVSALTGGGLDELLARLIAAVRGRSAAGDPGAAEAGDDRKRVPS